MVRRSRYDALLMELMEAHRESLHERLNGIDTSVKLVAHQAEEKNKELNDVRHRFIPREVFDQYVAAQAAKTRALLIAMAPMALGLVGLALQVLGR